MQNTETGTGLAFWKKAVLGTLGGLVGTGAAIGVYYPAESKWCSDMFAQGSYCSGQGVLVLGITVPLCAVVASSISMLWTWYSIRIPPNAPWASVFSYSGRNRARNVACAVAIQAVYWAVFAFASYRLTLNLLL
jgi:hypothetical protein